MHVFPLPNFHMACIVSFSAFSAHPEDIENLQCNTKKDKKCKLYEWTAGITCPVFNSSMGLTI